MYYIPSEMDAIWLVVWEGIEEIEREMDMRMGIIGGIGIIIGAVIMYFFSQPPQNSLNISRPSPRSSSFFNPKPQNENTNNLK